MTALSLYTNSVSPVTALTLTHTQVRVTWYSPNPSTYTTIRLVRNQYAFSETQEDGEILYEFNNAEGSGLSTVTTFTDGVDTSLSSVPLISGQYAYYTVWLLVSDLWVNAGSDSVLVPKNHSVYVNRTTSLKNTHMKVMELLPRVLTSVSNSPFDVVDTNSDLWKFMKGIALTYDEILTHADLTVRSLSAKYVADSTVLTAFNDLGLRVTSTNPTVYKKNLISNAKYLLATKGLKTTLSKFVETFTGFNTTVTDTINPNGSSFAYSNLLLNQQDSSFHKGGVGSWLSVSNATLSVESSTDIPTTDPYSFKSPYRLKVVTASGSIQSNFRLGTTSQVSSVYEALGYGIPVTPGQSYSFSWMGKLGSGTPTIVPYIAWHDAYGTRIQTDTGSSSGPTSSWARSTYTSTAPGIKFNAISYTIGTSSTGTTITTDSPHGLTTSNKVYFEDEYLPFSGVYTISAVTTNTITIPYYQNNVSLTSVSSSVNGTICTFTLGSGSTRYVRVGQTVTVTAGTGTLGGATKVVSIPSDTTFTVDVTPSVALSNATVSVNTYTVTTGFTVFKANSAGTSKETPAEYAMIGFTQTAKVSTFYLTSIQFALTSYATNGFVEARCVDIYLDPSKVNYLIDPTFAASTSGWSSSGTLTKAETTTLTGVPYVTTSPMGKVVTSSGNTTASTPDLKTAAPTPVVNNNTYYTFSIYIKGDDAYSLTLGLTDGVNTPAEKVINVTTSWQRVSVTLYVKSIDTGLTPYIYSNIASLASGGNGTRSASQTLRIDDAQLEESQKPTDYFDGSFNNQGARWSGVPNASKSYLYVNKDQKMSELSIHMDDWVPINMTWMVRSAIGIEAVGIPGTEVISSKTAYQSPIGGRTKYGLIAI
jgi:hypothetical protein